jgi:cation:H+ antiporter
MEVLVWLKFLLCAGLIGVAGMRLSRYADAIAVLTGISRSWIGLVLLATVTSFPELATGLSAVTLADATDIALGDALGSCMLNLAILALIERWSRGRNSLCGAAGPGHVMAPAFGVILLAGAALAILLTRQGLMPTLGHVSLASPALVAMYLVAMRSLFVIERSEPRPVAAHHQDLSARETWVGYAAASAVVVSAGIWLPSIGVELAHVMGWSDSLVGTLFVAFATSAPELATTWGAVRIGATGLAIANLLGSNLFDVLILAIDDFAYVRGPIYFDASPVHAVSAVIAALMSAAVIVALVNRPVPGEPHPARWASLSLLALYMLGAVVQWLAGR